MPPQFLLGIPEMFAARRQARMASSLEKARAQAALDSVQREQGFRQLEDPREQAQLRQSMYARGMGKSSIAQQEGARLSDIQARRNAALASQRQLSEQGLSLIRKQRRYARRMFPLQVYNQMLGQAAEIGGAAMGGAPGAGGGE